MPQIYYSGEEEGANRSGQLLMKTDAITIHVDYEVAKAYKAASEEDRRKMDLLAGFQLAEFQHSPESLEKVMDDMGREAHERGLTPEILDSILHE